MFGAATRTRTLNHPITSRVRYQLRHGGMIGWHGWTRTIDRAINSRQLYLLSYMPRNKKDGCDAGKALGSSGSDSCVVLHQAALVVPIGLIWRQHEGQLRDDRGALLHHLTDVVGLGGVELAQPHRRIATRSSVLCMATSCRLAGAETKNPSAMAGVSGWLCLGGRTTN